MANLQVGRIATVANTANVIDFEVKGYEFLVTNLTDSNIYVSLGSTYNADNSVIVPPETSRVVTANKMHSLQDLTNTVSIMPSETSDEGVEVQCILY